MRVAVGQIIQESNSFAPFATTREHFEAQYVHTGEALLHTFEGARVELSGMLSVLKAAGVEPVPLVASHGSCGGPLTRACFESLMDDLLRPLERAAKGLDGVCLALHGAMAVEDQPDAEGEIVARVRAIVGPGVPIGVSLDLHGHVTPAMLAHDAFFVGYQAYPHIDMYETGERTARLLLAARAGDRRPVMALVKKPMLVSPVNGRTLDGPLREVYDRARAMEAAAGPVLHVSFFPVQPWLDFEDLGFAALVCADGDAAAAEAAAAEIAEMAWDRRERLLPELTPLDEAIRAAHGEPGLTVVGDCGDAPSGGAAGDNATVLRALLDAGADRFVRLTYLTLVDAPAAAAAARAGAGALVTLPLGHAVSSGDGEPVTVTATVRVLTDGVYTMGEKGLEGVEGRMGPTAVLAIGSLRIAVRSVGGFEWDTGLYTSVGLELRRAALVFVKSPSHYRATFGPHADRVMIADTPGSTSGNLVRVPYRKLRRPIHPLDPI